jgi:hypothetical protein
VTCDAILLVVTSYVHWHLWDAEGYRHIPTIGWLFLAQWISGLLLALTLVLVRQLWTAIVAAGFVASTIGGFLLSVTHGLFVFHDSWFAPYAKEAFVVELAALVSLVVTSVTIFRNARATR